MACQVLLIEEKGNLLELKKLGKLATGDEGKEPLESLRRLLVTRKETPIDRQLLNTCCNFHLNLQPPHPIPLK